MKAHQIQVNSIDRQNIVGKNHKIIVLSYSFFECCYPTRALIDF